MSVSAVLNWFIYILTNFRALDSITKYVHYECQSNEAFTKWYMNCSVFLFTFHSSTLLTGVPKQCILCYIQETWNKCHSTQCSGQVGDTHAFNPRDSRFLSQPVRSSYFYLAPSGNFLILTTISCSVASWLWCLQMNVEKLPSHKQIFYMYQVVFFYTSTVFHM
jgi:hypothetical protein